MMRRLPIRPARSAYTLLELILALAIAVVILGGLYLTMENQLTSAQAGRELVQDGTLARAVMTRITNDAMCQLGAVDPKVLPEPGSSSESAAPASEAPAMESTTPNSSPPAETTPTTSTTPTAQPTLVDGTGTFNMGVLGQSNQLVLYVSRVPRELNMTGILGKTAPRLASDLRRITYWIVDGPNGGLARQEVIMVTGEEIDTLAPDINSPKIIAPEVKKIEFQYFDGHDWWSDWDGSLVDTTQLTSDVPRGPPAAIAVTITIERRAGPDEPVLERTYRQVIALPAGNNYPQGGN